MQKNTNKKTNKKSIKLIVRPSQFHSITKMLFKVRPSIFSKTFNVNDIRKDNTIQQFLVVITI